MVTKTVKPKTIASLQIGNPSIATLDKIITPARVKEIKANPESLAFVKALTAKLAADPAFMAGVEKMLKDIKAPQTLSAKESDLVELASFGWDTDPGALPSAKQAAAAVGAAVAAVAAGPAGAAGAAAAV